MILKLSWKVCFAFLVSLSVFTHTYAQNITLLDSLQKELRQTKQDSSKSILMAKISACYWYNNSDSAVKIATRGLSIAEKAHFKKGIAKCLNNLGSTYVISGNYPLALEYHLNALEIRESLKDENGIQASYSNIGNIYYYQKNYTKALDYYNKGLAIAKKIQNEKAVAILTFNIGGVYFDRKEYQKTLTMYLLALKAQEYQHDKYGICNDLASIGDVYLKLNSPKLALPYFTRALNIANEIENKEIISKCMQQLAEVSLCEGKMEAAEFYAKRALALAQEINDLPYINSSSETLYKVYFRKDDTKSALFYYKIKAESQDSMFNTEKEKQIKNEQHAFEMEKRKREIEILEKDSRLAKIEIILLGGSFLVTLFVMFLVWKGKQKEKLAKKQLESQKEEIEKAYDNVKQISKIGRQITSNLKVNNIVETVYGNLELLIKADFLAIGIFHEEKNELFFPASMDRGQKLESYSFKLEENDRLAVVCFRNQQEILINDFHKEYEQYISTVLTPKAGGSTNSIIYLPLETKEKLVGVITVQNYAKNTYCENQIDILKNIALYTAIAIENAEAYAQIQEQKHEISEKNEELNQLNEEILVQRDFLQVVYEETKTKNEEIISHRDLIEKQRKDITDSVVYASRIQHALLHNSEILDRWIPNHFILFKPRNFVSGDFYWCKQFGNKLYLAVADCTGHGVPGAFMSMLGISLLNEIVSKNIANSPSSILSALRTEIKKSLKQTNEKRGMQDGMDISFCIIDLISLKLQYAGAHNPLYLYRVKEQDNEPAFFEFKGDRMPIGIHPKDDEPFTDHEVVLNENDRIYLFSDGYQSQNGGEKRSTFKSKRLKQTLSDLQKYPISAQKKELENILTIWQGNLAQVDDILMIGIEIEHVGNLTPSSIQ